MFSCIKNENSILGSFKKKYTVEEVNERKFRSDPLDGLRPLKKFRKYL